MPETTLKTPRIPSLTSGLESSESVPSRFESRIRRTTTASVLLLAAIAAIVSFRHMHELALKHGEDKLAAALIPLAVDGTIVAASMSLLLASRTGRRGGALPWTMLVISSLASLGANIAVAEPTLVARLIAGWPSFALIGAYEMLTSQIRMLAQRESELSAGQYGQQHTPPPRGETGRILQLTAWQWAQANRDQHGKIPSGLAIAQKFGRSPRWGRLVKRAGLAGELPSRGSADSLTAAST
jgi:hypothetical protein